MILQNKTKLNDSVNTQNHPSLNVNWPYKLLFELWSFSTTSLFYWRNRSHGLFREINRKIILHYLHKQVWSCLSTLWKSLSESYCFIELIELHKVWMISFVGSLLECYRYVEIQSKIDTCNLNIRIDFLNERSLIEYNCILIISISLYV